MGDPETIRISVTTARERSRRRREMIIAAALFFLVAVLTWVELTYLGVDSYLFLALFNINFILLALVLFIVMRNAVKLLLDRRRRVLGARLRSRLVTAFVTLSLIPTVLMFLVSVRFVQTSVDFWFKSQVESSMQQALDVGQAFYASAQERLGQRAETLLDGIVDQRFAWGGRMMHAYLGEKLDEYHLSLVGVLTPDLKEQNWHIDRTEPFGGSWPQVKSRVNWEEMRQQPRFWSILWPGPGRDFAVGILPVDDGETGYLVLAENIGQGLMFKLDGIMRGVDEYNRLQTLKNPLKVALYIILGALSLLIVLGSIWFGFRLAKELTAPIQALAQGTERIAGGDLSVRLDDDAADEFGVLVRSFNRMAEDLGTSREGLTRANLQLERQNVELERRGDYIEAVLDNIAAGVVSLDASGRISTVNKAAADIFGMEVAGLRGRTAVELLPEEYGTFLNEAVSQLLSAPGARWQRQVDFTQPSGAERKLLVSVVGIGESLGEGANAGAGLVAVFEDITELEKMQRMAAWREVARRIAHEIKNPLTPIKLSAQRIMRKFGNQVDDPALEQCTDVIVREVGHLQQMVTEFSAFAKLPEVRPRPGDIMPLLEEVVDLYRHTHSFIRWDMDVHGPLPFVRFDSDAVRRALINLFTNAAEAVGRKGGRVRLEAWHEADLGLIRIQIADNGPGLSAEARARVFEPYFSGKKGGTGLGLTIAKSIISDHRGYIRVSGSDREGTTFVIELPV